jgi:hypothetical protein
MANHRITVKVVDGGGGQNTATMVNENQTPTEASPGKKKKQDKDSASVIAQVIAVNSVQKMIMGVPGRIGDATGNYMLQRQISTVMNVGGYVYGIAQFGVAGVVYAMVDMGLKSYDSNLAFAKKEIALDTYRQSIGMASASGSRYKGRWF